MADISPERTKIYWVNDNKLWIFYYFCDDNFLDRKYVEINLGKLIQKEAVCFVNNDCLYITDTMKILEGTYIKLKSIHFLNNSKAINN